jgi:Mrp family chromosome partitioning ATPase
MSKNFELLQNISKEKELFQTLDGWEDTTETGSEEPDLEVRETGQDTVSGVPSLPDVFQSVSDILGPLGPSTNDSSFGLEEEEEKDRRETQRTTQAERFLIDTNALTPLNSTAAWIKPEMGREAKQDLEQAASQNIISHEELEPADEAASFAESTVQERRPAEEEKTHHDVPHPAVPASTWADESKSAGKSRASRGRKVQPRGVYRDSKREAIACEEEFKLVQRIFLGSEQNSARIALFSGVDRDGGCASICVRAGEILASQAEGSVCLVDANFQHPSLHEYFGLQNGKGLAEATLEGGPIQEFAQQVSAANLWLIPGGSDASHLSFPKVADQLRARIEELRHTYRYVVIYSGPLWLNGSALMLSKWTDGVVLVLEANSTRRDTARRIKESLTVASAKVLGVVLNNRTYPIPEELYSRL